MPFDPIKEVVSAVGCGEIVIVMDDESRENEGDMIMAAEFCTTEKMAFIVRHGSGMVCAPMTIQRLDDLELPLMVNNPSDPLRTAYTITVDYRHNTSTGISAHDRALTVRSLASPEVVGPNEFLKPGHVFPLQARPNGVLERRGHTEAAVDLCRLAGCRPVGVICELVNDQDGSMMRRNDCMDFAKKYGLKISTIEALERYRMFSRENGTL